MSDLHAHVRTPVDPPDPLHCRRASDQARIRAQAKAWRAFQDAIHEGRSLWEANILSCRTYHDEMALAAAMYFGNVK